MNAEPEPFRLESEPVVQPVQPQVLGRPAPKPRKSAAPRRVMTADENVMVECLKRQVTTPPACWDKRFIRDVGHGNQITEKEAAQVWRLFHKYRRQITSLDKQRLLDLSQHHAAPDLRKQAALERQAAAERRRIAATR